jgi:hypothetical protein
VSTEQRERKRTGGKKSIKVIPKLDHGKLIGDQVFQNYVDPEEQKRTFSQSKSTRQYLPTHQPKPLVTIRDSSNNPFMSKPSRDERMTSAVHQKVQDNFEEVFGQPNSPKPRYYGFGNRMSINEKSVNQSSVHEQHSQFTMEERSAFTNEYHDAIELLEHNKFFWKQLPTVSAVRNTVDMESQHTLYSEVIKAAQKKKDLEKLVKMLPANKAYLKVIKMRKQGIEINCVVEDQEVPRHETNSESSKADTVQAQCKN